MDDAFCGGPDGTSLNSTKSLVSKKTSSRVVAIILMGDPRHVRGLAYNAGNATAGGVRPALRIADIAKQSSQLTVCCQFAARPLGFQCPEFEERIQLYCDSPDPFCSNGTDAAVHQGYGEEYGFDALRFIVSKLLISL